MTTNYDILKQSKQCPQFVSLMEQHVHFADFRAHVNDLKLGKGSQRPFFWSMVTGSSRAFVPSAPIWLPRAMWIEVIFPTIILVRKKHIHEWSAADRQNRVQQLARSFVGVSHPATGHLDNAAWLKKNCKLAMSANMDWPHECAYDGCDVPFDAASCAAVHIASVPGGRAPETWPFFKLHTACFHKLLSVLFEQETPPFSVKELAGYQEMSEATQKQLVDTVDRPLIGRLYNSHLAAYNFSGRHFPPAKEANSQLVMSGENCRRLREEFHDSLLFVTMAVRNGARQFSVAQVFKKFHWQRLRQCPQSTQRSSQVTRNRPRSGSGSQNPPKKRARQQRRKSTSIVIDDDDEGDEDDVDDSNENTESGSELAPGFFPGRNANDTNDDNAGGDDDDASDENYGGDATDYFNLEKRSGRSAGGKRRRAEGASGGDGSATSNALSSPHNWRQALKEARALKRGAEARCEVQEELLAKNKAQIDHLQHEVIELEETNQELEDSVKALRSSLRRKDEEMARLAAQQSARPPPDSDLVEQLRRDLARKDIKIELMDRELSQLRQSSIKTEAHLLFLKESKK